MPSETFFRLPEEKRIRIFEAAVDEFAAQRFAHASINHIIKAAGIPRGSFYQYFLDKEDLYAHVLQEISKEKIGVVFASQTVAGRELNFYELITASLPSIISWVEQNPRYSRIGMLMLEDDPDFIHGIFSGMADSLSHVRELLNREQQAGRLRPGVQPETVLRLILAASMMIMRDFFEAGNAEEAKQRLLAIYDIICYGVMRKQSSAGEDV